MEFLLSPRASPLQDAVEEDVNLLRQHILEEVVEAAVELVRKHHDGSVSRGTTAAGGKRMMPSEIERMLLLLGHTDPLLVAPTQLLECRFDRLGKECSIHITRPRFSTLGLSGEN